LCSSSKGLHRLLEVGEISVISGRDRAAERVTRRGSGRESPLCGWEEIEGVRANRFLSGMDIDLLGTVPRSLICLVEGLTPQPCHVGRGRFYIRANLNQTRQPLPRALCLVGRLVKLLETFSLLILQFLETICVVCRPVFKTKRMPFKVHKNNPR
jgi:hypothetical protein